MPGATSPIGLRYPLYTEAVNPPSQIQMLADDIDDALVASQALIASIVARKASRMSSVTNQSIPNNAVTLATFTTEDFDNDNMINLAGSTTNMVVQTAGLYLFTASATWATNGAGVRQAILLKNGVAVAGFRALNNGAVLPSGTPVTHLETGAVADIFTLQLFQDSGGALNCTSKVFSASRVSG
jgi:hypothetical protein